MVNDQGIRLQLDQECDGEFPETTACLTRHRPAVEAIGQAAFDAFDRLGVYGKRFEPVELLSASEVERLFGEAST